MADYYIKITTDPTATTADQPTPLTVERLVRAKNQAQAVAHVVKDSITVELADTESIMWCAQTGVKLEHAA